jgi:hypothetical protein
MLSQLTNVNISNIEGGSWAAMYTYHKNGELDSKTVQGDSADYTYDGYKITSDGDGNTATYDLNGRQRSQLVTNPSGYYLEYDWDGRLTEARAGSVFKIMQARYTPEGVRIYKEEKFRLIHSPYYHKYIVDTVGDVPTITGLKILCS